MLFFKDTDGLWLEFIGQYSVFFMLLMLATPLLKLAGAGLTTCLHARTRQMTQT
jgi:hypothetical protein